MPHVSNGHRPLKHTPDEIIEAIQVGQGYISKAAEYLGSDWDTVKNYIVNDEDCNAAYRAIKEKRNDVCENQLMKQILKGNITAIIFYAKTQMKDRGYIERDSVNWREFFDQMGLDADKVFAEYVSQTQRSIENAKESVIPRV